MVNAIAKANVLNEVNGEAYDMFKIYLRTNFHVPAFNISSLVIDKLQKLKTFRISHICVYLIPQNYSAMRLAPVSKSITTDYLTSCESTTFILLTVKH
jgi:rRNA-processing protein FCF1